LGVGVIASMAVDEKLRTQTLRVKIDAITCFEIQHFTRNAFRKGSFFTQLQVTNFIERFGATFNQNSSREKAMMLKK